MQSGDKAYPDSFPIASGNPASSIPHLLRLLDRPIAFHRCFVTLTGSVTAALMLSQALYWQQRTKDPDGWWYKKQGEWTDETGLSRREQENARRKLQKLSLLHEERRGVPAKLWYRVDEIRLLEMLARSSVGAGLDPVPDCTKAPILLVRIRQSCLRKTANHLKEQRLLQRLLQRLSPPPQTPPPRTSVQRNRKRSVVVVFKTKTRKTRTAATGWPR